METEFTTDGARVTRRCGDCGWVVHAKHGARDGFAVPSVVVGGEAVPVQACDACQSYIDALDMEHGRVDPVEVKVVLPEVYIDVREGEPVGLVLDPESPVPDGAERLLYVPDAWFTRALGEPMCPASIVDGRWCRLHPYECPLTYESEEVADREMAKCWRLYNAGHPGVPHGDYSEDQ